MIVQSTYLSLVRMIYGPLQARGAGQATAAAYPGWRVGLQSPAPRPKRRSPGSSARVGNRYRPTSRPSRKSRAIALGAIAAVVALTIALACSLGTKQSNSWEDDEALPERASVGHVDLANLATVGKNAYFDLRPGCQLQYTDGSLTRTVTVCHKTKFVDGVNTRVIEEKVADNGKATKAVWKYYAIDTTTGALYCFGVHVQEYHDGQVTHRSWLSGVHGANFKLAMPATLKLGDRLVRGAAKTVYEVTDTSAEVVTPAGTFTNCLRTESTGAAPAASKVFAPGLGLVQDGQFTLVKIARTTPKNRAELSTD